jgi:gamma-glutamyltranspeptidase/glutathione hydrolase
MRVCGRLGHTAAMHVGVAAGHPATAEAGREILAEGGNAADAAVAACLASCVAETVMTGIAGGGHAIWWDGREARVLDFFVTVPGLGAPQRHAELVRLEVPFGTELVHYAVGIASCAVPGVPDGLRALHEHGRLPWTRVVEPALRLARNGVPMPPAHAACLRMLEPVLTMDAGSRIYAPGGRLLEDGDLLRQPGLVAALSALAEEGPRAFYEGSLGEALLELSAERGGLVTRSDLHTYRARWVEPREAVYAGHRVLGRDALQGVLPALARLEPLRGLDGPARAVALARALDGAETAGHTTNLVTADADGNACVVTTSLGLGSGDFLPGYDVHLNSMLGEADLVVGELVPGERMASMMSPTLALDGNGLALAIGAAGGTRLRSALVQSLAGVLDEGLAPQAAVSRPRVHPALGTAHLEPGWPAGTEEALAAAGFAVRTWPSQHHFFGGVSAIGRGGLAADPRRSGYAAEPGGTGSAGGTRTDSQPT